MIDLEQGLGLVQTGRGGKAPCRQTLSRRRNRVEVQRSHEAIEQAMAPGLEEIRGAELARIEGSAKALGIAEELDEEGLQEADGEEVVEESDEESDESTGMAESLKGWPVLSRYQLEQFKHRILTKGKHYSNVYKLVKRLKANR